MTIFPFVVAVILLPMTVTGQYNASFCQMPQTNMTVEEPSDEIFFPENFYLQAKRYEMKADGVNLVSSAVHLYSKDFNMIKSTIQAKDGVFILTTDAKIGDTTKFNELKGTCEGRVFSGNTHNDFIATMIWEGSHGRTSLASPQATVEWRDSVHIERKKKKFIGGKMIRGIPVDHWKTCDFDGNRWQTVVTDWYFSNNTNTEFPAGDRKILISKVSVYENGTDTLQTDYSFLRRIKSKDMVKVMARPCGISGYSAKALPKMPTYFTFEGEQVLTMFDGDSNQTSMMGFREIYDFEKRISYVTSITASDRGEEVTTTTTITDFNRAFVYSIDQNTHTCGFTNNLNSSLSSIAIAGGLGPMRTPKQFFDTANQKYEYFGNQMIRGFDCDVWTTKMNDSESFSLQNTYSWALMTKDEMKNQGFPEDAPARPVRLTVEKPGSQSVFDIFHYSTQREKSTPVMLDLCAELETSAVGKLTLNASYTKDVVQAGYVHFTEAFMKALQRYSYILTPLRFCDIHPTPNPNNANQIFVSFRIFSLGFLESGDVQDIRYSVANSEAVDLLKQAVDKGRFYVDMASDEGYYLAAAKSSLTFTAVNHKKKAASPQRQQNQQGYSKASVAGLAIGMTIMGLLLSAGGVYLFKRYRNRGVDGTFSMNNLSEKQQEQ